MIYLTAVLAVLTITGIVMNIVMSVRYYDLIEDYGELLKLYGELQFKEAMKGEKYD